MYMNIGVQFFLLNLLPKNVKKYFIGTIVRYVAGPYYMDVNRVDV